LRALSLLSIVIVLVIVALMVRTQLRSMHGIKATEPGAAVPASAAASLPNQVQTDLNKMMNARPVQLDHELKDGQP